jgi:hypothetical protein
MSVVGNSSYLAVQQSHILNPGILDNVLDTRVLSDTSHAHAVGVVAPQVLHEDVGCVGLGREAVVANVDTSVCHTQTVNIQGVKPISVLG